MNPSDLKLPDDPEALARIERGEPKGEAEERAYLKALTLALGGKIVKREQARQTGEQ